MKLINISAESDQSGLLIGKAHGVAPSSADVGSRTEFMAIAARIWEIPTSFRST